tara:strand:- start:5966 stop:6736 length:771 start_codon:yes stop_codon:yes gene_type:complete
MLEVKYNKTLDLIPYVNNSRTHSDEQITQVAASIKEFGFTNPILLDDAGGIIAGHGRLQAAKKLGMKEVPTITLLNLSEAQKKAYVIADNQLALNSDWNFDMLSVEIDRLKELDFDISLLGFDNESLMSIVDPEQASEEEDHYTKKADAPTYEPSGEKPDVKTLYADKKTFELIENIKKSNISQDEKDFLMLAAGRHTVLDFELIANYYAHSDKECQGLMEENALVIIDFKQALANGYAEMSDAISEQYTKDYPNE